MSGEWPADPSDPRCPHCGEPVSATASYCMHCEADLPAADVGDLRGDDETDDVTAQVQAAAAAESGGSDATATGFEGARPASDEADRGDAIVDPDSLLDDVSTVALGLVAGLVDVVLLGLVAFWGLPASVENGALWIGLLGGAGIGVWVGYSPTVLDAARKAGYATGGLLALVPPTLAFALNWAEGSGPIGGTIVFGVFVWPVAAVLVGAGWLLGKGGVDG